jgi:hypothetical protein
MARRGVLSGVRQNLETFKSRCFDYERTGTRRYVQSQSQSSAGTKKEVGEFRSTVPVRVDYGYCTTSTTLENVQARRKLA